LQPSFHPGYLGQGLLQRAIKHKQGVVKSIMQRR
jgi:hypothetical protein